MNTYTETGKYREIEGCCLHRNTQVGREITCLGGWCHSFSRLKSTGGGSNSQRGREKEKLALRDTSSKLLLILDREEEKEQKEERGEVKGRSILQL